MHGLSPSVCRCLEEGAARRRNPIARPAVCLSSPPGFALAIAQSPHPRSDRSRFGTSGCLRCVQCGRRQRVWKQLPPVVMVFTLLIVGLLFMTGLLATIIATSLLGFDQRDRIAAIFCGSRESLIVAVPMANVLFPATIVGRILVPIMTYHPMQLVVGAWLAKRLARPTQAGAQIIGIETAMIVQAIAARVPEQAR